MKVPNEMNGLNMGVTPNIHISTCTTWYKKGIYENFQMKAQKGIKNKIQAYDMDIKQLMNRSNIRTTGRK